MIAREVAKHGTILRMGGLRSQWTERMFRRLSLRLSRLLSPFRTDKDRFVIHIISERTIEAVGIALTGNPRLVPQLYPHMAEPVCHRRGAPANCDHLAHDLDDQLAA